MHYQLFLPHGFSRLSGLARMQELQLHTEIDGASFCDVKVPDGLVIADGIDRPAEVASISGQRGHLVYWMRPGQVTFGIDPQRQVWRPAAKFGDQECGRYWIGFDLASPPTPADLARPYRQFGHETQLGDGQSWILPKACELPRDFVLADDGTWRYQLQRRFWDFQLETLQWQKYFASDPTGYDLALLAEYVRRALAINYRLLPEVVSHLRLLNSDNVFTLASQVMLASLPDLTTPA